MLGKVTGEVLLGKSSAFSEALVVTVVGLVGASHWRRTMVSRVVWADGWIDEID